MKEMKKIAEGKNFTACDFGKLNDLGGYVLQLGDIKIPGKVFGGQAVGATGGDFSFQIYQPGQEGGFYHTHKNHEEPTSCSAAKENTRLTASTSPSRREASCV